jgi:hypothetical protein
MLGVSDFSATCAELQKANSREQNANATFEVSMERTASVRKKLLSIDPGIARRGLALNPYWGKVVLVPTPEY